MLGPSGNPQARGESQRACVMFTEISAMLKLLDCDRNGALRRQ
jgi:hypothetical protein